MRRKKSTGTSRTPSEYEEFLRALKLIGLGLENCSATLNLGTYFGATEKGEGVRQIQARYRLDAKGSNFFEPTAQFKLAMTTKKDQKSALLINCVFSAHFHVADETMSDEHAERFTNSEFRVIMWPYFRQLVMDLTARMSIPPLIIPFASPAELRQ